MIENIIECDPKVVNYTPIQEFYENQSVFITGGTGFLGKTLIEKLVRSCPGISKIFLIVREKKDRKIDDRMKALLQDPMFDKCRSNEMDFEKKIHVIAGDCSLKNLGLSDEDADLLKQQTSIVFHVAATVRFDEKLKRAVAVNIESTSSVVHLCKGMKNLKAFVHVSTAYANCFTSDIEEKFYDYPVGNREIVLLVNALPERTVEAITPQLIEPWPNTYLFTKALAEDLIRDECKGLPVAIFRPAIVTPSAHEPLPGWCDNFNGPVSATAGVASGVMRVLHCDPERLANFVPVDLTVNALIASAWQINRRPDQTLIYNFTSTNVAPISWGTTGKMIVKYIDRYPLRSAMWRAILRITKRKYVYNAYVLFLHLIPACFVDFGLRIVGQKPRLLKVYAKIHKMASLVSYFGINKWQFRDDNVQDMWNQLDARDQRIFRFSMLDFDWERYLANFVMGVRIFLFHDDLKTLERSRRNYKRFIIVHQLVIASLVGFACWMLWKILAHWTPLLNFAK